MPILAAMIFYFALKIYYHYIGVRTSLWDMILAIIVPTIPVYLISFFIIIKAQEPSLATILTIVGLYTASHILYQKIKVGVQWFHASIIGMMWFVIFLGVGFFFRFLRSGAWM